MTSECFSCDEQSHLLCAGRIPVFSSLDEQELRQVVALIRRRKFYRGALIISEGSINQHLLIVSHGKIKVCGNSSDGREHLNIS
jgi:CRP/FNR family transcriptional regulator